MLSAQTRERIESYIQGGDLVVFMKGNRSMPQCGFSGRVVQILDSLVDDYTTVDVLSDPEIQAGAARMAAEIAAMPDMDAAVDTMIGLIA